MIQACQSSFCDGIPLFHLPQARDLVYDPAKRLSMFYTADANAFDSLTDTQRMCIFRDRHIIVKSSAPSVQKFTIHELAKMADLNQVVEIQGMACTHHIQVVLTASFTRH